MDAITSSPDAARIAPENSPWSGTIARRYPIGPCAGLHQGMVWHQLVEIKRRTSRHIEASDPHGADKHQRAGVLLRSVS